MYIDDAKKLLLSKTAAVEEAGKGDAYTYTVGGETFALLSGDDDEPRMTLKCDPELALALREGHNAIRPGVEMEKNNWNTLHLESGLSDAVVADLVNQSHKLIIDDFSDEKREELGVVEEEEEK